MSQQWKVHIRCCTRHINNSKGMTYCSSTFTWCGIRRDCCYTSRNYYNWFLQQIDSNSLYFLGCFPTIVIEFLLAIFSCEGNLSKLISDKAPLSTAVQCEVFLKERHIKPWNYPIYYPHANEKMEYFNWVLKDCLQAADLEGKPCKSFAIDLLQKLDMKQNSCLSLNWWVEHTDQFKCCFSTGLSQSYM